MMKSLIAGGILFMLTGFAAKAQVLLPFGGCNDELPAYVGAPCYGYNYPVYPSYSIGIGGIFGGHGGGHGGMHGGRGGGHGGGGHGGGGHRMSGGGGRRR